MKNGEYKLHRNSADEAQENQLLVADMVQYLSSLAKLHEENKTGNLALSKGLRHVAHALRPYGACSISELARVLKERASANIVRESSSRVKSELPPELESICHDDIERILVDESYTKKQVAELGVRRFGISRSKLERLSKKDAMESVRSALEHEKSLDVISREAQRSGMARSA